MSDDEYCYYDDYDYFDTDSDDDDDDLELDSYYDEDFDDEHSMYMAGSLDHDDIDSNYVIKAIQVIDPADQDRKAIYKELSLPDPNDLLKNPRSLIDICSLKVALVFPFAYIEDRTPPIPENIQLKVIEHSFPQSMEKIKRYCVLNNGSSTEFDRAIRIIKSVKDLKQIGFHLSANIEVRGYRDMWYGPPGKKSPNLYVTIKFDRGKITETHCPCEMSSSWCYHVIAVCLVRIFKNDECIFKPPLSDSLNNLRSYAQLRTFTQYLIAEFCDGRIIESAQNVLDRMLTPRSDENDAIDQVWGAPDPTAGPGIDEDSQWLICEEGLKSRCTTLIRNTEVTEGCWGLNISEIGPSSSVMEWWKNFQLDKPVVADYFCNLSDVASSGNSTFSYNYYRHSYSREKSQEIAKFLTTCEELVRDDYSYSLKAVKTFTLQLIDVIKERNQRDIYRYDSKVFESNAHLGCVPRPQRCWLFPDQLARLWRLLLLCPQVTEKQKEEIFTTLDAFDIKIISSGSANSGGSAGSSSSTGKKHLRWDSQKHIRQLKEFSWDSLELGDDPFKSNSLAEVTIDRCVVMETQTVNPPAEILNERFSYPISLKCGSFCSSVTVYSYIVEALIVYGKLEQAVHVAMALALAIVRYYNSWLEGDLRVSVHEILYVDWNEEDDAKDTAAPTNTNKRGKRGKRGTTNRKRGRKGTAKDNEKAGRSPKDAVFHEETGIIPVTSLAYLLHVLQENVGLLAEMLKLVKVQHRGIEDEDMGDSDDVTSDAQSLIFRLGVVALAIPKIRAPSLLMQVEWFNWETYIADKMAKSAVTDFDLVFLRKMTYRLSSLSSVAVLPHGFVPPYGVVMTLFTHLYKPSPAGKVSEACVDALNVALKTIEASSEQILGVSMSKRMFFESCRRHWVKLVETVIYAVANRSDHLKQVLQSIFVSVTMIGSPSNNVSVTSRPSGMKKTTAVDQKAALIYHMIPEKVIAAIYLSHSLVERADKIRWNEQTSSPNTKQQPGVSLHLSPSKERKAYETLLVHGRKVLVKELPMCDQRKVLYETAIKVGTYAYAVKNNAFRRLQLESYSVEYNFPDFLQRNLRWLCRLSNKIDVKAFDLILERHQKATQYVKCFNDDEIVRLCTQMLESEQKREDRVWLMVKDVLLTLLKGENQKKINDILELCRSVERERTKPAKRALLFPAICKELLNYLPSTTLSQNLKLDYLSRAMKLMQTLFKDTEADDNQGNLSGLKELFADSSVSSGDKPGTSKEKTPQQPLDRNLQLSFDLCLAAVVYLDENDKVRGYESRRRCESMCEVVAFVAQKACQQQDEDGDAEASSANARDNTPDYEEVYISRFVEVLCNTVKDCLLLTDFFFELSSRLLVIPQHGSFGRDKVLLSDDIKVANLCKTCTSLSVLLKRCIAGLIEAIRGDTMKIYLKETTQDTKSYLKTRAKHSKFYYGSSLVSVLGVLKRLMQLTEGDEDFDSLSYKLAAKHPVTKAALEELNSNGSSSSPRNYEDGMLPEEVLSSLLLRRMFSPALAGFEYDSDEWRY